VAAAVALAEVVMVQRAALAVLAGAVVVMIVGWGRRAPKHAYGGWLDPDEWFPDFSR
jgi:hypothetical protein